MKRIAGFTLAALFALAPAAHAQITCAEIEFIHSDGMEEFEDLTGAKVRDKRYSSKVKLQGATFCEIEFGYDPTFNCRWEFDSKQEADRAYAAQAAALAGCLTGWRAEAKPVAFTSSSLSIFAAVTHSGVGEHEHTQWQLVLGHTTFYDPKAPYGLELQWVYFWE